MAYGRHPQGEFRHYTSTPEQQTLLSYCILHQLIAFVFDLQFQGTRDGKTLIPYWDYEMEPLENYTAETFQPVLEAIFKPIFDDLEKGAQRLAAAGPDHAVDSTTTETL